MRPGHRGRRRREKKADGTGGQAAEALGRSRGGFGTKVHAALNPLGHPVRLELTGSEAADSPRRPCLIAGVKTGAVLAEKTVTADPDDWIAQEPVALSTHPTVVDGQLAPRHVDLRPFAFADGAGGFTVLPGGFTRVALEGGNLVVNASQGGGGKDTWVV